MQRHACLHSGRAHSRQSRARLDEGARVPCLPIRGAGLADLQARARRPHAAHAQACFKGVGVEESIRLPAAAGGQGVCNLVDDLRLELMGDQGRVEPGSSGCEEDGWGARAYAAPQCRYVHG